MTTIASICSNYTILFNDSRAIIALLNSLSMTTTFEPEVIDALIKTEHMLSFSFVRDPIERYQL